MPLVATIMTPHTNAHAPSQTAKPISTNAISNSLSLIFQVHQFTMATNE